jgi:hypothetical protein
VREGMREHRAGTGKKKGAEELERDFPIQDY